MAAKAKDTSKQSIRDALQTVTVSRLRQAWLATRLMRGIFFAGAAAVASVCQYWTWASDATPATSQVVGIAATVVVCLSAIISIVGEQDASREILVAQRAFHRAEELRERLEDNARLYPDIERMVALHQAISLFRDHIETVCVLADSTDEVILSGMLTLGKRQIPAAAGFTYSDQWTICLYRAVQAKEDCRFNLVLVEHLRAIECEKGTARVWREGVGVAGVAFSNKAEIVIDDLTSETALSVFKPADTRFQKSYDDDRYRSMVAVPISVQGMDRPWGMVTATSAHVGHFNHEDEDGLKAVEAIRAVARYAALAVAVRQARGNPGNNGVTS